MQAASIHMAHNLKIEKLCKNAHTDLIMEPTYV